MRCYHLNNTYMASIHAGIQSGHAQHALSKKYLSSLKDLSSHDNFDETVRGYEEWMANHETMIVLNAGMQENLQKMAEYLSDKSHTYAWASFSEEKASINDAMTNIALVLPFHMYAYSSTISSFLGKGLSSERSTFSPDIFDGDDLMPRDFEMFLNREDWPTAEPSMRLVDHLSGHTYDYNFFDLKLIRKLSRMRLM